MRDRTLTLEEVRTALLKFKAPRELHLYTAPETGRRRRGLTNPEALALEAMAWARVGPALYTAASGFRMHKVELTQEGRLEHARLALIARDP